MSKKLHNRKTEKNRRKHELRRVEHNRHLTELTALKQFKESTGRILEALEIPDFFKSVPKEEVSDYYSKHVGTVQLIPAEGTKVSERTLKFMRKLLCYFLKTMEVRIDNGNITLEDFMTAGIALGFFKSFSLKRKAEYSDLLSSKIDMFLTENWDYDIPPLDKLTKVAQIIEIILSRINGTLYYLDYDAVVQYEKKPKFSFLFVVYQEKAVVKDIIFDGKSRPAYRAGSPMVCDGIQWASLSKLDLGVDCPDADKQMDVYVQSHALIRLRERIDTLDHGTLHVTLTYSIDNKEVILHKGKKLLAYIYNSIKLGYFLLEVVDSVVLIKTFLFITNTGTPEGDKLDEELKVGKIEKEFVGIGKLSTFLHSDIMQDERVRNIFRKVGLEQLCNLPLDSFDKRNGIKKGYAADFVKYMNLERREEY